MINKSKFKSHKFKNNDDEFLFFGTQKSIEQNLENLNNIDISDKYYVQSGNQSDWSTCSILRELNETILTVDQNKDKGLPKINTIEENQDKFFINCSLMGIDNFFEEILKFKKKGTTQEWDKRVRNISKIKSENDYLIFLVSSLSGLKNLKARYGEMNNDVKLKFKIKNGIYNIETFYFDDIFDDTEPSGFNTLGHLIEKEE
ncbi:hypothetical protein HIMB5_00012180 [alpha proteobacterium HIMB5]|nr:hypothetical protein HIMB5_00012180 [alpha proteobacterium HIMB5]